MFRRRVRPPIGRRVGELLWPSAGWKRRLRYLFLRLARLSGSPYSIAAGFACGAAVSFTPFLGFHILLGVAFSWLLGGNPVAAMIGTLIGNPWTFPFIWWWTYWLGHQLLPGHQMIALKGVDVAYLTHHVWDILAPMALGGVLSATLVWFASYYPVSRAIVVFRRNRASRRGGPRRPEA